MPSLAEEVLSKQQLTDINRGLAAVDKFIQKCDLAESCSVDCAERRAAAEDLRQQFNQFKATFFPNAK